MSVKCVKCSVLALSHCVRGSALENGVIKIRLLETSRPSRHLEVARKKEEFVNLTHGIIGVLTNVVEMSAPQPDFNSRK